MRYGFSTSHRVAVVLSTALLAAGCLKFRRHAKVDRSKLGAISEAGSATVMDRDGRAAEATVVRVAPDWEEEPPEGVPASHLFRFGIFPNPSSYRSARRAWEDEPGWDSASVLIDVPEAEGTMVVGATTLFGGAVGGSVTSQLAGCRPLGSHRCDGLTQLRPLLIVGGTLIGAIFGAALSGSIYQFSTDPGYAIQPSNP